MLGLAPSPGVVRHHFIVQPSSKVVIHGKTNVNSFQCSSARYSANDTLILQEGGAKSQFIKGFVGLEAAGFDCGLALMTSDFSKTIKVKEYPVIGIEFKSFEPQPNPGRAELKFKGVMTVHLTGVSKTVVVDCTMETTPQGFFHLKGARFFKFADFKLVPPKRMMGMVAVQEEIKVQFHLVLKLDPDLY